MAWFNDWFNSDEYLNVYSHRNNEEAEVLLKLILSKIQIKNSAKVLDMACGAGRHAVAFAKRGFKVTAVDLSSRLLDEAKKNATAEKVKIKFVLSDIRTFLTDEKFDLTMNLFTSIGYFKSDNENFLVIRKAYNVLNKQGCFVLDYFNKNYIENNLVSFTTTKNHGTTITQQREIQGNRIVKKIAVEKNGMMNDYYESVRLYDFDELRSEMEKTGFAIKHVLGDFYGSDFDRNKSPRLIIFAEK